MEQQKWVKIALVVLVITASFVVALRHERRARHNVERLDNIYQELVKLNKVFRPDPMELNEGEQ